MIKFSASIKNYVCYKKLKKKGKIYNMAKKILFLDLDGTLLNDQKQITTGNRNAIEKALAQGHNVVIASGRPLPATLSQAEKLNLTSAGCYVIAYNGAVLWDCGEQKELYTHGLDFQQVYTIFDEANRRGLHIQTYTKDCVVVEPQCDDEAVRRYCSFINIDYQVIKNVRKDLTQPPAKVLIIDFDNHEILESVAEWIRNALQDEVDCFFSNPYYLEIVRKDINKGDAVARLCRLLQHPIENAIAVGDEANDIPMIQAAGVGVAMANSVPAVKEIADYITKRDNNHDAIQEVIERFL